MDPPRVSAYNIASVNTPSYSAAGPPPPNSEFPQHFQLHDITGPGYAAVKLAEKARLRRAQTRPDKTIGTLDLRSGEVVHSRPFPKFPLKPRQAIELANTADAALPASGPEPRQSIAPDPATTAQSETPHRTEDLRLDIESLLPPVTGTDRFGTPINTPIKPFPRPTQATTSGQPAAGRPSEHTGAAELEDTPTSGTENTDFYDISKPTCSLNLVCYRSGAAGCDLQQLHCILRWKFPSEERFLKMTAAQPHLIATDRRFFQEMRKIYKLKMCGFFRRHFSLKTLKTFRILAYTPSTRPTVVPFDDFILQEMMYAYRNPHMLGNGDDWIEWVFRLRRRDVRHALEFVEGWDTMRIAVAGMIPWVSSCLIGIVWTAAGGDPQTTFTVASFVLTSSSIVLALLAIISSIES